MMKMPFAYCALWALLNRIVSLRKIAMTGREEAPLLLRADKKSKLKKDRIKIQQLPDQIGYLSSKKSKVMSCQKRIKLHQKQKKMPKKFGFEKRRFTSSQEWDPSLKSIVEHEMWNWNNDRDAAMLTHTELTKTKDLS